MIPFIQQDIFQAREYFTLIIDDEYMSLIQWKPSFVFRA